MLCQYKYCDKKILSRFAMKIWNNVRIQETLYNAEMEARLCIGFWNKKLLN